uniref:SKP1 component dimerisation domain-containing protein n=1 Tax=Globodera rostochiensis TaxID=31243 RepID=A0A914GSW3_GLORO
MMVNARDFLINATKNGDLQHKRAAATLIGKSLIKTTPGTGKTPLGLGCTESNYGKNATVSDDAQRQNDGVSGCNTTNNNMSNNNSSLYETMEDEITPQSSNSLKPDITNGKLVKTISNGTVNRMNLAWNKDNIRERETEQSRGPSVGSPMVEIEQPEDEKSPPLVKIQARKVNCKTSNGELHMVDWYLMQQSKHFKRIWEEHKDKKKGTNGRSRKFTFNMDAIDAETFRRVLEWLVEHDGMDDPVIREDPATGDRVWFELTEFEDNFFDVPLHVLNDLLNAGKILDIPSLYLFGCQSMASLLQNKNPAEIREMLGLDNDLTSTDVAMIRRRNRKFKMRELKAASYATRLQQLQSQLQQMGQGSRPAENVLEHLMPADAK